MSSRELKDQLYPQFARITGAIASPKRLELLELLAQSDRTVENLAKESALSVANVSRHLQILKEARLVDARKEGLFVRYRLAGEMVFRLIYLVRTLAEEHLSEIDRITKLYLSSRDEFEPVSREDLLEHVQAGTVIVLDVRPNEEYSAGHIPGAFSIPIEQLQQRLQELPEDKEIVAYCRGPYCIYAYQAVEILRRHSRQARRLIEGFPEWKVAGLPIEMSA